MLLQCKQCKSRNTKIIEAGKLAQITKDKNILLASTGTISGELIAKVLNSLFDAISNFFTFKAEKEKIKEILFYVKIVVIGKKYKYECLSLKGITCKSLKKDIALIVLKRVSIS